jgi:hypothetical protein
MKRSVLKRNSSSLKRGGPIKKKAVSKEDVEKRRVGAEKMRDFFLQIWNQKPHKSEVSSTYLGKEAKSIFFHHILPKAKYKEAMFDPENIILLTWEEHDKVERDTYYFEEVNVRREKLKSKYSL